MKIKNLKCPYCYAKLQPCEKYCPKCETNIEHITEGQPDDAIRSTDHCFIATAAYGTPFAAEIIVLKKWRDISLRQTIFGRTFIEIYYLISPPIASVIKKSNMLRSATRKMLGPIVKLLRKKY